MVLKACVIRKLDIFKTILICNTEKYYVIKGEFNQQSSKEIQLSFFN